MNVRLFVAADLPGDVRAALAAWRPDDGALRAVDAQGLHVTLCFLGWRDEARAEAIGAAATACAAPVGPLTVQAGLWLPPRRPRVLAVRLDDPKGRLAALQQCVSDAMVGAADYEPEARPFLPHVTVARARRGARPARGLPGAPALGFRPRAVTLFESRTGGPAPRYVELGTVALPGG